MLFCGFYTPQEATLKAAGEIIGPRKSSRQKARCVGNQPGRGHGCVCRCGRRGSAPTQTCRKQRTDWRLPYPTSQLPLDFWGQTLPTVAHLLTTEEMCM